MGLFEAIAAALAWAYAPTGNLFLALVFVAVPLRLVLLPLYVREQRSRRALRALQPQVDEIMARHGDDRHAAAKEISELQGRHGGGSFMGCLGLLVLVIVFTALFKVMATPLAYMGYSHREGAGWEPRSGSGVPTWLQESELARDLAADAVSTTTLFGDVRLDCSTVNVAASSAPEGAPDCGGKAVLPIYLVIVAAFTALNVIRSRDPKPPLQVSARPVPLAAAAAGRPQVLPIVFGVVALIFPLGLVLFWMVMSLLNAALLPLFDRGESDSSLSGMPPPAF